MDGLKHYISVKGYTSDSMVYILVTKNVTPCNVHKMVLAIKTRLRYTIVVHDNVSWLLSIPYLRTSQLRTCLHLYHGFTSVS